MDLTWAACEEMVITTWLTLCDALTFPVGLHVHVLSSQLPRQESPTRGIVLLFANGAVWAQRGAGTCLRVRSELQTDAVRIQLAWILFFSVFDKYLVSCYHVPGAFPGAGESLLQSRSGLCSLGFTFLGSI